MWKWTHFPKRPSGETCVCRCLRKARKASTRPKALRRACSHSSPLQNLLRKRFSTFLHHHQAPPASWIPTWPLTFWTMTQLSVMTPWSSVLGVQVPARCHTLAGPRRGTRFPSRGKPSSLSPGFTLSFHLWILGIPQRSDCGVNFSFLGSRPRLYRRSDEPIPPTWTWPLQHKGSGSLNGNVPFTETFPDWCLHGRSWMSYPLSLSAVC